LAEENGARLVFHLLPQTGECPGGAMRREMKYALRQTDTRNTTYTSGEEARKKWQLRAKTTTWVTTRPAAYAASAAPQHDRGLFNVMLTETLCALPHRTSRNFSVS
jgi:hypothetical protein